ncbi:MAG: UDP-N-acetylmuramate dehydrogenase [Synergistaceae bacterium]|nr:UDP-N-acetylmuramate dehydrogenase [Synergistaceae bacterium]
MRKTALRRVLACPLEEGKELAPLSALGVGGRCEFFAEPSKLADVAALFQARVLEGFPIYILGGGTNTVFADGEIEGVVLSTLRLSACCWSVEGSRLQGELEAEAGYPLPLVVAAARKEGLGGAEFAQGIPGTLAGAVAGNAGAGGSSVGDLLDEVTTVEANGEIRGWRRGEFHCSYRFFSLASPTRFIAACKLKFWKKNPKEIQRDESAFLRARAGQPRGVRSAGCAFKNPPGDSAGRLLDACGCKGLRVGGAAVSGVHANFLLNEGGAAGGDVFRLVTLCRDIVFGKTGILLEPEIKFMGFPE